jgi:hypothetical protein
MFSGQVVNPINPKHFNPGDELLVTYKRYNSANGVVGSPQSKKMFVIGVAPLNTTFSCNNAPGQPVAYPCTIIIEPGSKRPEGSDLIMWAGFGDYLLDVNVKVLRSGRRNMLGSTVQQLTINGAFPVNSFDDLFNSSAFSNPAQSNSSLLASNVTTYRDDALNHEFTAGTLDNAYTFSAYLRGEVGNPREWSSYRWLTERSYGQAHTRKDGVFKSYNPFWIRGSANELGNCTMEDYIMFAGNNPGWTKLKEVITYNAYGLPVEEVDASLIPSTALYAYNYTLPIAVAQNAKSKQIRSVNFEDLMQIQNNNKRKYGIWPVLAPKSMTTTGSFVSNYGKLYWLPSQADYVDNAVIDAAQSHSGRYSLKFNGLGRVRIATVTDFAGVPYGYISLWVKRASGEPVPNDVQIYANGVNAGGSQISQVFNAFAMKAGPIDGWYKYEGKIAMGLLSAYTGIHIQAPSGYSLDDIRIMPDGANMKTFVYDPFNSRLQAELDGNNFATFYEYDQEGVLVRVKKESERGILTVNEHRKANAKHVQ